MKKYIKRGAKTVASFCRDTEIKLTLGTPECSGTLTKGIDSMGVEIEQKDGKTTIGYADNTLSVKHKILIKKENDDSENS